MCRASCKGDIEIIDRGGLFGTFDEINWRNGDWRFLDYFLGSSVIFTTAMGKLRSLLMLVVALLSVRTTTFTRQQDISFTA
jgi:hypothetical protein